MQNTLKRVVFAENPSAKLNLANENNKFINLYKIMSPQTSSPLKENEIKEMINKPSSTVNLPNNTLKFCSIKEFEQKTLLYSSNLSSKPNGNIETSVNQSIFSQINDNIMGYKSEKMGQMETEVSNLLKSLKDKQDEIASLKSDIKALTIALKEKDIIHHDTKFLENSLNTILLENTRLNKLTKDKITENENYNILKTQISQENEYLKKNNKNLLSENQSLKHELDISQHTLQKTSKNLSNEIDLLKKHNTDLFFEIQSTPLRNSQMNESPALKQEIEQLRSKIDCMMNENIRLNEQNNEKAFVNENLMQLVEKSEELIKENERLNILIKEQTIENNSWRKKLHDSDQKLLYLIDENNEKTKGIIQENKDFLQRNQKLLEEINELVSLIKEKDKNNEENNNLRKLIEKKDEMIKELSSYKIQYENCACTLKDLQRKHEGYVLENIKLNNYVEEKLKDYNALEVLNSKIDILISENTKLNNMNNESQNQIDYWKSRYFSINSPMK